MRGIAPHDGGAGLRRNDEVERVFEDQHAVADRQRQRAARSAFAADDGDGRDTQTRHFADVARNRFGLTALFRAEAGISAGQINEADDGRPNFSAIFMQRSALR